MVEKCVYAKDPTNPEQTICTKEAKICSPMLFGAGTALEQFAYKRFQKNADLAYKGLHWILDKFQVKGFKLSWIRLHTKYSENNNKIKLNKKNQQQPKKKNISQ